MSMESDPSHPVPRGVNSPSGLLSAATQNSSLAFVDASLEFFRATFVDRRIGDAHDAAAFVENQKSRRLRCTLRTAE
jgi:hypothetical protein